MVSGAAIAMRWYNRGPHHGCGGSCGVLRPSCRFELGSWALRGLYGFLEVPFLNAEAYGIGPNPLSREQKTFRTAPLTASDRIRSVLLLMAYKWLKWLIIALKYASKATGLSSEVHDRDDLGLPALSGALRWHTGHPVPFGSRS